MTHEIAAPQPEDLLRQTSWIRALALALVRDADVADDLVQETLLVALRHEGEGRRTSRGWLARVLRNLARQRWRGDIRRERREEAVAGSEGDDWPTPDELAERLERHRMLAEMVSELDEPLRATVLLRYFEDQSSKDIAKQQGVPAGTVRWRLKRALDLLQGRLDERWQGDRKAWCLALLPLAAPRNAALASASAISVGGLFHGVLTMSGAIKFSMVAMVLAALLFWWTGRDPASGIPGAGSRSASEGTASPEEGEAAESPAKRAIETVPLGAGEEASPRAEGSGSKRSGRALRIRARFIDEGGRPLPGVELVAFQRIPALPALALDLAAVSLPIKEYDRVAIGVSDEDGLVDAEVRLKLTASEGDFSAWREGLARAFKSCKLRKDAPNDLGEIVLGPGAEVRGTVRDRQGEGVPGAVVRWRTAPAEPDFVAGLGRERITPLYGVPWARCDEQGRYDLAGIVPGTGRVIAGGEGLKPALSEPLVLDAGASVGGVDLELAPGGVRKHRIELRVVDAEGRPCAGVRVRGTFRGRSMSGTDRRNTDVEGVARYAWTGPREWDFIVTPKGEAGLTGSLAKVTGERRRYTLTVTPATRCRILLKDRWGRPVPGIAVKVTGTDPEDLFWVSDAADARGEIHVGVPPLPFGFLVSSRGFEEAKSGPHAPEAPPQEVTLRLRQLPGVIGSVKAEGRRLSGVRLSLHARTDTSGLTVTNGFPCDIEFASRDETRSDEDGGFRLAIRAPGSYFVVARAEGFAPAVLGPLELAPDRAGEAIDLEMVRGGRLEGRLSSRDGRPLEGRVVGISRGGFLARTAKVDAQGRYRFEGLTPGRYMVKECDEPVFEDQMVSITSPGAERRFPWRCLVFDGRTTTWDLQVGDERRTHGPARLEGRLKLDRSGTGPMTVVLLRDEAGVAPAVRERSEVARASLDATGQFRLEAPHPGVFTLRLTARGREHVAFVLEEDVLLEAGDNRWSLDAPGASLSGTVAADASGARPVFDHRWTTPRGGSLVTRLVADDAGQLPVTIVPAGPALISPHGRKETALRRLDLRPGATRTLKLP